MDTVVESPALPRIAVTKPDRLAAFRLRYNVYIAEQRKGYPEVDHQERLFHDEIDEECDLIVVEKGGSIVGTGRTSWFNSKPTEARYSHAFEIDRFMFLVEPAKICVCSRLAVLHTERDSQIRSRLFEFIYQNALKRDTRLCFLTCAPLLLGMFAKYSFREYGAPIRDPIVGVLHRVLLVLDDLEHLQRVRSPFLDLANKKQVRHAERPWLDQLFESYKSSTDVDTN